MMQWLRERIERFIFIQDELTAEDRELDVIMTKEVNAINEAFYNLGVDAWVKLDGTLYSPQGNFIRYLLTGPGLKLSTIQSYAADVQMAINEVRRSIPGAAKVIVKWRDGLSFDVPYPLEPQPLLWDDIKAIGRLKRFQMFIGGNFDAETPAAEILDFSDESIAHLLIGGGSGSGKSVLLNNLVTSWCEGTPPDKTHVVILDTKRGRTIKPLAGLPHVTLLHEVDDCIAAVRAVTAELERRKKEDAADGTKILLVLEELADMMSAADDPTLLWQPLIKLSSTSREFGIHMVACTQYPSTETVLPSFRTNFLTRLGGQFASDKEGEVTTGRTDIKCSMLPGKGAFYLVHQQKVVRVQSAQLKGEHLAAAVGRIAAKYEGIKPYSLPILRTLRVPSTVVQPVNEPVAGADVVMGQLADLVGKHGDLVRAWVDLAIDGELTTNIIRKATGANGQTGKAIRDRIEGVVNGVVKNPVCTPLPEVETA